MGTIRTFRSSKLSLFQSLTDDLIMGTHPRKRTPGARPTLEHPLVLAAAVLSEHLVRGREPPEEPPGQLKETVEQGLAWTCVRLAGKLLLARLERRDAEARLLEDALKDSDCDPGWVETIVEYVEHFGFLSHGNPIPYVSYRSIDDFVLPCLPPDATVALIGDWGTGTDDATRLLEEIARKKPDALIHLGDIYYSGTDREAHAHFLDLCQRVFEPDANSTLIYTLSGNHDMYAGGTGYYGMLPLLNSPSRVPPGAAQPASFFCLRTTDASWQFLVMDTGLNDHDPFTVKTDVTWLDDREAEWHLDKIDRFSAAGGKTILLSHHQLFTAFDSIGNAADKPRGLEAYNPRLLSVFEGPLRAGSVAAWFWGHEHNLCIYEPYGPLERGRCIGHGAVPVFQAEAPYRVDGRIPDPPKLKKRNGQSLQLPVATDGVYRHGYVLLRLNPETQAAEASYYLEGEEEQPFYRETIA